MKPARNASVDALRLLFAYGVILIHLSPNTPAAEALTQAFILFAVPYFLTVSMFFVSRRAGNGSVTTPGGLHLERIVVPYAAWTLVYTGLHWAKCRVQHVPFHANIIGTVFYGEAAVHLYFLPLLLLSQAWLLGMLSLRRVPGGGFPPWAVGLVLAGAGVFAWGGMAGRHFGFGQALTWSVGFAAAGFVLSVVQSPGVAPRWRLFNAVVGGVLVVCLVVSILDPPLFPWGGFLRGPVAGYAMASVALALPPLPARGRVAGFLLGCSYGIYLAHFAFLEAFEFLAARLGLAVKPYTVPEKLAVGLGLGACCVGFIALARTLPGMAFVLLGEARRVPAPKTSPGLT